MQIVRCLPGSETTNGVAVRSTIPIVAVAVIVGVLSTAVPLGSVRQETSPEAVKKRRKKIKKRSLTARLTAVEQ
jgi:hypothetical protein